MASTIEDRLLDGFRAIAGTAGTGGGDGAVVMAPAASPSRTGTAEARGVGSTLESIGTTVLKSGLGLAPLVGQLFGLFGGGGASEPAPDPVRYSMPGAVHFEGVETGGRVMAADYDQMGTARAYGGTTGLSAPAVAAGGGGGGVTEAARPAPQITVNVQAMDARSFLDRSADIAQAVREAMLNMSSLNDVVSDL